MLEQILNNDENTNEDARSSQVGMAAGSVASHDDDQYGYFEENGSTYHGWVSLSIEATFFVAKPFFMALTCGNRKR